jgi:predicted permease
VASIVPLMTIEGWKPEGRIMSGWIRDIRGAFRQFRLSPSFAAVVVLTVAVGVGSATSVYSVLHGVVRKPLAFADSERVVTLWGQSAEYPRTPLTVGDHNALANEVEAFELVSAEWGNTALLLGEGEAEQVRVGWVTPTYFEVLETVPHLGRVLRPEDVNAVMIDHELWVRRYGSDPDIVGRVIDLGGAPMEVVGVLRAGDDPNLTTFAGGRASNQVWRLQPADWTEGNDRSIGWLRSSARLRDGVTVAQAQAEVDGLMTRINQTVTDRDGGTDLRVHVTPVRADLVGDVSGVLWMLLGAVCGVLLIAAVNVANLMLGRGQGRAGEVAVRAALGGSRYRIFRQFMVESAVLAAVGGALGTGLSWVGTRALVAAAPPSLPRIDEVAIDGSVLVFALVSTIVAAVLFGIVPAMRGSRTDLAGAMNRRTATGSRREQRLSRGLVVVEVALSLCLLAGTGLLLRSLQQLNGTDLGFEKESLLTFALEAPELGETAEEAAALLDRYIASVEDQSGVVAVGVTNRVPLAGGLFTGGYRSAEMVSSDAEQHEASFRFVTPDYFAAMGANLRGRSFTAADSETSVLVDEQVAERLWPGEDAVGKRLEHRSIGADPVMATVIGVVSPMKHGAVSEAAPPIVFLPMLAAANQQNFRYMVIRVQGDALASIDRIRAALRTVDPNAVMARVRPMEALYDDAVASTRFAGQLLAAFGIVAALLAAIGLHGVMALFVRRRTREFGIRVALGAGYDSILRSTFASGMGMVALGSAIGVLLALALSRFLGSLLYGIAPTDTLSLALATAVMAAVGLLGAWLPARRARRIDPVNALRTE